MLSNRWNLKRTTREEGFTLIELLVVILIIGIIAGIAITSFMNQRKIAVDATVKADVHHTAKSIETWNIRNNGQSKPLPDPPLEQLKMNLSHAETKMEFHGTGNKYCLVGTNDSGDVSSTAHGGWMYFNDQGGLVDGAEAPTTCDDTNYPKN